MDEKMVYTVLEAARALGVSESHTRRLIAAGLLKAANVGLGEHRRWRISRADLDAFLAEHTPS